jgi:STE24 endopeptidase
MDAWVLLALGVALAKVAAEWALTTLNLAELRKWESGPPADLAQFTTPERHRNSTGYSRAKLRTGVVEELWGFIVLAVVLTSGVLPASYAYATAGAFWSEALWLVLTFVAIGLASLPFDAWGVFAIEQRFGFNRMTPRLWLADKLKETVVGIVIGFLLIWVLLLLVGVAGSLWWVWGWLVFLAFQALMILLYPRFILPLFNKLTPMAEGELKTRLEALAAKAQFPAAKIEVMDGSKRSGHSNAFFTGFGRARRLVLYDTLIRQLNPSELEAVLAHEIGHYRCGHIPRMLGLSASISLLAFAAIGWLARSESVLAAFGFEAARSPAPAFMLAGLVGGSLIFWLSPLLNVLSRHHEYEADRYAKGLVGSPEPLAEALRKLQSENLSNLTPHPLYSAVHYSHPAIKERLAALRS